MKPHRQCPTQVLKEEINININEVLGSNDEPAEHAIGDVDVPTSPNVAPNKADPDQRTLQSLDLDSPLNMAKSSDSATSRASTCDIHFFFHTTGANHICILCK